MRPFPTRIDFPGYGTHEYQLFEKARSDFRDLYTRVSALATGHASSGQPGELTICELGCGDGTLTYELLSAQPGNKICAVDLDAQAVRLARDNLHAWESEGRHEIVCADALDYLSSLSAATLDVVASAWALHNLETGHRLKVLDAIRRALKPGGLFVNGDRYADHGALHQTKLRTELGRYFECWDALEDRALLAQWILHIVEDQAPCRIMYLDEAIASMQALGFVELAVVHQHPLMTETIVVARTPG